MGDREIKKVVCLGSGRVAVHLCHALMSADYTVTQIFSREESHACRLAQQLGCGWTTIPQCLSVAADLYIFALSDAALADVISQLPSNAGLWIHTSGSTPMDIFKNQTDRYGVLYPLQTFSHDRPIDFKQVPCFIEANTVQNETILRQLAYTISDNVHTLDSQKRQFLHLAAVFACNFSNHMYTIAHDILREHDIPFDVLRPLIEETADKIHRLSPHNAQTGPAKRKDQNIINRHLQLLDRNPAVAELYKLISNHITKG